MSKNTNHLLSSLFLVKRAAVQNYGAYGEPITPASSRVAQTGRKVDNLLSTGIATALGRPTPAQIASNSKYTPAAQPRLQEGPSPAGAKAYDPMNVMGLLSADPATAAAKAPAPAPNPTQAPAAARGPIPTLSAAPSMMMPTDTKIMPKAQPAAAGKADLNSVFAKFMGSSFDPKSKLDRSKMKYLQTLADQGLDLSKARASDIYDTRRGYGKWA